MRIAILCPGPSLLRWSEFDEEILIGVNRAPAILEPAGIRCHWWVFSDWKLLVPEPGIQKQPSYRTRVLMGDSVEPHAQQRSLFLPASYTLYRDLYDICPYKPWTIYTVTASMMLAKWLGAAEINCYGCDHTNEPDADGVNLDGNKRDADRWKEEGVIRSKVIEWLVSEGVTVNRRMPDGVD